MFGNRKKVREAVTRGFDPFHDGHLDHITKAMQLGDHLIVIIARDNQLIAKKGYYNIPFEARKRIVSLILKGLLGEYQCNSFKVVENIDHGITSSETIRAIKPDILAKGGDRTPDNMPLDEIKVCKEIGCQVVYGVGDLLNSSSKIGRVLIAPPA
ncbi:adenylyltransferase/cytidyltransferase family protein [Chloroflexota bacterium]